MYFSMEPFITVARKPPSSVLHNSNIGCTYLKPRTFPRQQYRVVFQTGAKIVLRYQMPILSHAKSKLFGSFPWTLLDHQDPCQEPHVLYNLIWSHYYEETPILDTLKPFLGRDRSREVSSYQIHILSCVCVCVCVHTCVCASLIFWKYLPIASFRQYSPTHSTHNN